MLEPNNCLRKPLRWTRNLVMLIAFLGVCHLFDAIYGWSKSPPKSIKRAFELAQKGPVPLMTPLKQPHETISKIYVFQRKYERRQSPRLSRVLKKIPTVIGSFGTWGGFLDVRAGRRKAFRGWKSRYVSILSLMLRCLTHWVEHISWRREV